MSSETDLHFEPTPEEQALYDSIPDTLKIDLNGQMHDFTLKSGSIQPSFVTLGQTIFTLKYFTEMDTSNEELAEAVRKQLKAVSYSTLEGLSHTGSEVIPNLSNGLKSVIVMGPFSGIWNITFSVKLKTA